jgi:hypothetical protein
MTAADLITLLSTLPAETKIFIWHDGDRLEINNTDPLDWWEDNSAGSSTADINLKTDLPS